MFRLLLVSSLCQVGEVTDLDQVRFGYTGSLGQLFGWWEDVVSLLCLGGFWEAGGWEVVGREELGCT